MPRQLLIKEVAVGRRPWLDEAFVATALEAVVEGATFVEVARLTGISRSGIRRRFEASGLALRGQVGATARGGHVGDDGGPTPPEASTPPPPPPPPGETPPSAAPGLTIEAVLVILVVALVGGAGLAMARSGDDSESGRESISGEGSEIPSPQDPGKEPETDEESEEAAPSTSDCESSLVEGEGEEFDTDFGPIRVCGARLEALLPGFEQPAPPGYDVLVIEFETADGSDPGEASRAFQPDSASGEAIVTLTDGTEAVREMGGLWEGKLVLAYTIPTGST